MTASRFCRYELRTTDVDAARSFYSGILGSQLWGPAVSVIPLPERAAAHGAPAHWLGHIGVPDVHETLVRIAATGGQQLGPTQRGADEATVAVLRDPFGAILGVTSEATAARREPVAWHLSHSEDHERAFAWYAALFGWTPTEVWNLGPERGSHQGFAWDESGRSVGSMANTARLPHIHPQWLFYFPVADIDDTLAKVGARGGKPLPPIRTSGGDLAAPCDDPQGGAFGLYQASARGGG